MQKKEIIMFRYSLLTLSSLSFSLAADSARPGQMKVVRWGKSFTKRKKNNCTYLSLAQKKLGVKREKKRKTKYGHHLLFPFTHPSCLLREKPKQVVVSCSGKVLEPFLALKVSVTRNLRVLPSVLSADSSSNVNQFWDVWSKIWSL